MRYGVRPDGMSDAEWTLECQNRHAAREMVRGKSSSAMRGIFEEWQKILPEVTKQRVFEIWRAGVPMPAKRRKG